MEPTPWSDGRVPRRGAGQPRGQALDIECGQQCVGAGGVWLGGGDGMSGVELIAELTDICIRQAEIIKAQQYVIEQFGEQVREEQALAERNRLRELVGDWEA